LLPAINDVLHIQVSSLNEEEAKQVYKSRITDMNERLFAIEEPIHIKSGKLKHLFRGDQLSVSYEKNAVKHYFQTEVVGFREDVISQVLIKVPEPSAITKVQRRSFLRVSAQLEVAGVSAGNVRFLALTEDLSGGGLSLTCDDHIELEEKEIFSGWLLVHFKNQTIDHIPFKAQIVRIKKLEEERKQLLMAGFSDILEADRQKIVRYCFEKQLELRK
jgi:c-di-GMP-binding flagellar brake protein YcgR